MTNEVYYGIVTCMGRVYLCYHGGIPHKCANCLVGGKSTIWGRARFSNRASLGVILG